MLNVKRFVWAALTFSCLIASVAPLIAQERDPVAESLNLTRDSGSLPLWEKPPARAVEQLGKTVRSLYEGVFLIGNADEGYGTGFVISRKHRLLATNAHVADIGKEGGSILAIRNGSSDVYRVEKTWYHPGVMRKLDNSLEIRSQDPADGPVLPRCPDVAVLRLADGPELPAEFALASKEEVYDAFAQPVGILGFPGHDTLSWPGIGEKAEASFDQGVISRVTDFYGKAGLPDEKSQFARHTMANWFGFSGSPIFLPNGHVVLVNNSMRKVSNGLLTTNLGYGIRVDCLWELLAYHDLDAQVQIGVDKSKLNLARFERENSQERGFRDAVRLIDEAYLLCEAGKFKAAGGKCNDAIRLAPGYANAYYERAGVYTNYLNLSPHAIPHSREVELANWALADVKKSLQLEPSSASLLVSYANALVTVKAAKNRWRPVEVPEVVPLLSKILDSGIGSDSFRASTFSARAAARGSRRESLADINQSIQLDPFNGAGYQERANYWQKIREHARASQDLRRAEGLYTAKKDTAEAFRLATSPDPKVRNPAKAVELASKACKATQYKYWFSLRILGIAYEEAEEFPLAVKWLAKALELAPDEEKSLCREDLKIVQGKMKRHLTLRAVLNSPGAATDAPAPPVPEAPRD